MRAGHRKQGHFRGRDSLGEDLGVMRGQEAGSAAREEPSGTSGVGREKGHNQVISGWALSPPGSVSPGILRNPESPPAGVHEPPVYLHFSFFGSQFPHLQKGAQDPLGLPSREVEVEAAAGVRLGTIPCRLWAMPHRSPTGVQGFRAARGRWDSRAGRLQDCPRLPLSGSLRCLHVLAPPLLSSPPRPHQCQERGAGGHGEGGSRAYQLHRLPHHVRGETQG